MKKILETERLYLREFTPGDAQLLIDLNSNPEVIRYIGDPNVCTAIAESEKIITEIIMPQYENKIGRWATFLKDTDEFIGWCGLKNVAGEVDLGYRFFQAHWGKGYATEAAKAVMDYGINVIKLENIIAHAAVKNINSIRVLEKVGLTFHSNYRAYYALTDHWEDSVKYVLIPG